MASRSPRCVIKVLVLFVFLVIKSILCAQIPTVDELAPEFTSIEQKFVKGDADYNQVFFSVRGRNIRSGLQIKATTTKSDRNSECHDLNFNYNISERQNSDLKWAQYELKVPKSVQGFVYLCLPQRVDNNNAGLNAAIFKSGYKWIHQGPEIRLDFNGESQKLE